MNCVASGTPQEDEDEASRCRAPTVSILDVRLAKTFTINGVRLEGMVDVLNALINGTVVNLSSVTCATFPARDRDSRSARAALRS
jgi:hypothetical protein